MSDATELAEGNDRRLNRLVAITVVLLSVAMAVGKIKDDNIVQAMQAAQADKIDRWDEYQATRIKAHDQGIAAALLGQFSARTARQAALDAAASSRRHEDESAMLKRQAIEAQANYDRLGYRDDQFDLSDGFLSIAVAVAAIAALVESMAVLGISWAAAGFGLLFLVAGYDGLPIHPDRLVSFLT